MGGSLEHRELTRQPVKKPQNFGVVSELPKYLRELQAAFEISEDSNVNLFAIYEQRREEFMAADLSPRRIVKKLQEEYGTRLNDRDVRNLYGWAREDYDRKRGDKPKIRPRMTTEEMMHGLRQDDRTNLDQEGEE